VPRKPPLRFATTFGVYIARAGDRLGEGGCGTVYRATDEATGAVVAVKVLDPSKAALEKRRRFKNEILFGLDQRHPNVLRVLDHGLTRRDDQDAAFYVMPLYATTLRGLIDRRLGPDAVVPLFAGLLDGVEAAHQAGVVHRDLKPENVLYDAERDILVVGDFGIAHFADEERFTAVETRPGSRLANFQYAAPEQRERGGAVDTRADVYALGLMLNEMFTGTVPLGTDAPTIAATAPDYAILDRLVAAMRQQSPAARPASIDVVRQGLPSSAAADPLVKDPVRVVNTDHTVPNALVLVLNHAPTPKWQQVMRRVEGSYQMYEGYDPKQMTIKGNRVTIDPNARRRVGVYAEDVAQTYIEFFSLMEREYPRALADEARQRKAEARLAEQARAEAERRRLESNKRLGI